MHLQRNLETEIFQKEKSSSHTGQSGNWRWTLMHAPVQFPGIRLRNFAAVKLWKLEEISIMGHIVLH
ncbi:hypothetical protein Lal_00027769 [Lupinus albus]|nr:hypothetical protein Lal_00027769 [Lupinus albus]